MKVDREYLVYIHINLVNGKVYIGQTSTSLGFRSGENGKKYLEKNRKGDFRQPVFANAILKYGWDNFSHEIIKDSLTKEEADALEVELISKYNSTNHDYGYNIRSGGSRGLLSEESKRKIGESNKKYCGPLHSRYGQKVPQETRDKISKAHKGRPKSKEVIEKISKTKTGMCKGLNNGTHKAVLCVDLDQAYECIYAAEKDLSISHENISKVCKGKRKRAGGYEWRYITDDEYRAYQNK